MGLKEQILTADDIKRVAVSVPEWGCTVYVRTLTGAEKDALELERMSAGSDIESRMSNFRARLVARALCDETGARLFTDEDAEALGAKSGTALDRVYEVASKLSNYSKEDVEAIAKN